MLGSLVKSTFLITALLVLDRASAWLTSPARHVCDFHQTQQLSAGSLHMTQNDNSGDITQESPILKRRQLLESIAAAGLAMWTTTIQPSNALVKGNAPPPKKSASEGGDKPKCTNVEECQALAEKREQELRESQDQGPPALVTAGGTRYREIEVGSGNEVKDGDDVQVFFKVLKLGKRSYDGLSGEGTVVFSRGKLERSKGIKKASNCRG